MASAVEGKIMSGFVRATKPGLAAPRGGEPITPVRLARRDGQGDTRLRLRR